MSSPDREPTTKNSVYMLQRRRYNTRIETITSRQLGTSNISELVVKSIRSYILSYPLIFFKKKQYPEIFQKTWNFHNYRGRYFQKGAMEVWGERERENMNPDSTPKEDSPKYHRNKIQLPKYKIMRKQSVLIHFS